jgi:hypothetical protein
VDRREGRKRRKRAYLRRNNSARQRKCKICLRTWSEAEERVEETQDEHEEKEARKMRRVSFADEKQSIGRIEVQVERKAGSRGGREGQRTRKRRKISLVPKNVPSAADELPNKDVYIIEDNRNNQLYLTLKDVDGKFIMLKRQSGKKKRGYHPVWWKYKDAEQVERFCPEVSERSAGRRLVTVEVLSRYCDRERSSR